MEYCIVLKLSDYLSIKGGEKVHRQFKGKLRAGKVIKGEKVI